MKNYYPEKPFLQYKRTTIEMAIIILYLQRLNVPAEIKRMAYIMFRNEGANGMSGICNNYCGFQADSGRWNAKFDKLISGVVEKKENGTNKVRYFLAFNDVAGCLQMLLDRVQGRGLYVGGTTHKVYQHTVTDSTDLATAYQREWVKGSKTANPTADELKNFPSMYKQAAKLFP